MLFDLSWFNKASRMVMSGTLKQQHHSFLWHELPKQPRQREIEANCLNPKQVPEHPVRDYKYGGCAVVWEQLKG